MRDMMMICILLLLQLHHDLCIYAGIGFAKKLEHNLALLKDLPRLTKMMQGLPILVGASRKRFIGTVSQSFFYPLACVLGA